MVIEEPLIIPCQGDRMIGILHRPEKPKKKGFVMVVADGPQYRAGCCRQLISWARKLSSSGYPVLRFDFRGMGDSGGRYKGFEYIDEDIAAAVNSIFDQVSGLEEVVLWGGCSAASACFMFAWRDERVKSIVALNPWVRDEEMQAKTYIKHYYLSRILKKDLWLKLVKFEFNYIDSIISFMRIFKKSFKQTNMSQDKMLHGETKSWDDKWSFRVKMREGLSYYEGKILLLMSGRSLDAKEFDELLASSPRWREILSAHEVKRVDMHDADQGFSRQIDRERLYNEVFTWID